MAILTRPQLVLNNFVDAKGGTELTHTTIQVTKTATMTYGTLLLADFTEAADADLAANVAFIIDDLKIREAEDGEVLTVNAVRKLGFDKIKFRASELKLGSTALTSAQVTTFGVLAE